MKEQSIYQRITRLETIVKANDRKIARLWQKHESIRSSQYRKTVMYKAEAEHLTEINVYLRMYISALRKEYIQSLSAINKKQADDGKN